MTVHGCWQSEPSTNGCEFDALRAPGFVGQDLLLRGLESWLLRV